MNKLRILNIDIDLISKTALLNKLKKGVVLTPNVDHLMLAQEDQEFYSIYKKGEYKICDSRILKMASFFLEKKIESVITGSDFLFDFCDFHKNNSKIKIFLLGADVGVAQKAKDRLNKRYRDGLVVGAFSPSFGFEKKESEVLDIIEMVNMSNANVLVVGLGAPKQEKFINKYRNQFGGIDIFLPLGATIDFAAGHKKRAPKIIQNLALEWLYRLALEPKRLFKRYLIRDVQIFRLLGLQILGLYKDPFSD